jgi:hypothetical protein
VPSKTNKSTKSWRYSVIELHQHNEADAYTGIDDAEQCAKRIKRLRNQDATLIGRKDFFCNVIATAKMPSLKAASRSRF